MNANLRNFRIKFPAFVILLVTLDQISKYKIRTSGGFYICNKGLAFNLPLITVAFFIFFVFLILFLNFKFSIFNLKLITNFKFQISNFSQTQSISFALISSGALSNIIDRLYFGCVIDFIDLRFWPVFNLADAYITIGAILLIMQNVNIKLKNDK